MDLRTSEENECECGNNQVEVKAWRNVAICTDCLKEYPLEEEL